MDAREQFHQLVAELAEVNANVKAFSDQLTAEWVVDTLTRYKRKHPRTKTDINMVVVQRKDPDLYKATLHDRWRPIANLMMEVAHVERGRLSLAMEECAQVAAVPLAETWSEVYRCRAHDYLHVGFGAADYARKDAEIKAAEVAMVLHDDHTHVRMVEDESKRHWTQADHKGGATWNSIEIREYVVEALIDPVDVEIVRLKHPMDLREWVRLCWSKGIQPRVIFPGLPDDYEKDQGLDYQGNDLRAQAKGVQP